MIAIPKRRWFRFSLRTMLALVATAAIGFWALFVVLPWSKVFFERSRFEAQEAEFLAAARTLKVGANYVQICTALSPTRFVDAQIDSDVEGLLNTYTRFDIGTASFFVCVRYPLRWPKYSSQGWTSLPCKGIAVYRVPRDHVGGASDIVAPGAPVRYHPHYKLVYADPSPRPIR
jgi:hypothetical protein